MDVPIERYQVHNLTLFKHFPFLRKISVLNDDLNKYLLYKFLQKLNLCELEVLYALCRPEVVTQ